MQLPIFEFHFIHLWIWPQTGFKLSLDTRLVNYYLPEVNIEGKYTCHVQEWPRNKLPNMVLADFAYKICTEPISVVQIVNVFQHWPLNDPYLKKTLNTAIVKYLVMNNYRNLLGDIFSHMIIRPEKALCRFQGYW